MDKTLRLIADLTDREFSGNSFNGHSLMETMRSLSAEEAASVDTFEGYTAWDNLVHCLYFKWFILRLMDPAVTTEFPWEQRSFPPIADSSEHGWRKTLEYAAALHSQYMTALDGLAVERLDDEVPGWGCRLEEAIGWIPCHDTYHTAQVRSMGLPALRRPFASSLARPTRPT